MREFYKDEYNRPEFVVIHEGEPRRRHIMRRGPKVVEAFKSGSTELAPAFVGVAQIDGDWWRVYNILGEYVTQDSL